MPYSWVSLQTWLVRIWRSGCSSRQLIRMWWDKANSARIVNFAGLKVKNFGSNQIWSDRIRWLQWLTNHHCWSSLLIICKTSPPLNGRPTSAQGMALSWLGLKSKKAFTNAWKFTSFRSLRFEKQNRTYNSSWLTGCLSRDQFDQQCILGISYFVCGLFVTSHWLPVDLQNCVAHMNKPWTDRI